MENSFGAHLCFDAYHCDSLSLDSEELVRKFLFVLPMKIGMNIINEPVVVRCGKVSEKDEGGISGFVLIAESHISIHTFPHRRFLTLDAYTCKGNLDTSFIKQMVRKYFGYRHSEEHLILRAKNFGKYAKPMKVNS